MDARLRRLRETEAAATPGPWVVWFGSVYPEGRQPGWAPLVVGEGVAIDARWPILAGENSEADAEFIAAAREGVPVLLDLVDRLTAELEQKIDEEDDD